MSLDNIQLGPFLIQHLYEHSIVELDETEESVIVNEPSISSLGNNEKGILVVVDEANAPFLPDADLALLTSILGACNLSLAHVALVNLGKNKTADYNSLMKAFTPSMIMLFGVSPNQLSFPLHFPHFQLQQYNHQTYLSAPGLNVLASDNSQKKEFWACLQKHFFKPAA